MKLIRTLHLLIALTVPALLGILAGLLFWLLTRDRRRTLNAVSAVVGWLGPRLAGLQIQCSNAEALRLNRPAIITFNHQSGLDPVILCALVQGDAVGVAKEGLRRNPLLGPLLRVTGTLFLGPPSARRERVLTQAEQVIADGLSIVIAPEGTRANSPLIGPFRSGACELAQRCGVMLVPVVIHDSRARLAPRSRYLYPGTVRVTVLPPRLIPPDQSPEQATRQLEHDYVAALAQG